MNSSFCTTIVQADDLQQLRVVLENHNSLPMRIVVPNPYTDVALVDLNGIPIPRSVVATWVSDDERIELAPEGKVEFVLQLPFWDDVKEPVNAKCVIRIETSSGQCDELVARGTIQLNIPSLEERLMQAAEKKKQGIVPRGPLNVSRFVKVESFSSVSG